MKHANGAGASRPAHSHAMQADADYYRGLRRAEVRQRRFWNAYIALAAAVAVATVFGIAGAGAGIPGRSLEHSPGAVVAVAPESASPSGEEAPDSSGAPEDSDARAAAESSQSSDGKDAEQAASSDARALEDRAADFAVDPARTVWNYETNGRKTVYLTIDDGPSENTQAVLDILDRYGCKATFFVVGHNDDYFPMIAEAFRRGHTIGLHSMTHDYAWVYSSIDAYYEDLAEIGEVVRSQIGFVPCFIRFPGGSSNMISEDYTEGIMTELTSSVQEDGYQYYDWNISVGDGAEHTTDEIVEYGTADEGDENIMLLCHDSATKQTTVEALPRIIEHYQSLGYSFEAIDRNSWVCHHGVNN